MSSRTARAGGSLLVVPGLGFGRGPAPEPVHQPVVVVPVHPRAGDLLQAGQGGDGTGAERDPSRVHSVLYSPMVVSAITGRQWHSVRAQKRSCLA